MQQAGGKECYGLPAVKYLQGDCFMEKSGNRVEVNFFSPSTANMKKEVSIAVTVLIFWFGLSYGIPLTIWLAGLGTPYGSSFLTETRFLGFPLHYWLIAQGCTIGYILLCKLYCMLWDRKITKASAGKKTRNAS